MSKKCLDNSCVRISLRILRWIPVLFVFAMIAWVCYAFGYQFCFNTITNVAQRIAYLIVFIVMMLLFVWSYLHTVVSFSGTSPQEFQLSHEANEELRTAETEEAYRGVLTRFVRQNKLPVSNKAYDGGPRLCLKCNCIKPDRAHHCSVCGRCVLKFDHHCPWVNNCVHYANYKSFLLFLGYGFYLCVFGFFAILPYFYSFWQAPTAPSSQGYGKFHVLFLFFVAAMFGISMGCLFFYHLYLTYRNQSTVESFRAPVFSYGMDKRGYDLGPRRNFREVFGTNALLWFLPIFSARGNGYSFPSRHSNVAEERYSLLRAASDQMGDEDGSDSETSIELPNISDIV